MELAVHAQVTIRNQTIVIHKTEDVSISHAVGMKDVKAADNTVDNVDQTHAQQVLKTWNMTSSFLEDRDSKVNALHAASMKKTGQLLCKEITKLTDGNAELVLLVKFTQEEGAKVAQEMNTLKIINASATITTESKPLDKIMVCVDLTIATTDNKLLEELVQEKVTLDKEGVKLVLMDKSLVTIEDNAITSVALAIRLRQQMEDVFLAKTHISTQMISNLFAENQIALLCHQIRSSFTEMDPAEIAHLIKLF
jgi:hypothetical protein